MPTTQKSPKAKANARLLSQPTFSNPEIDPFDEIEWVKRDVDITGESGEVIFSQKGVEVPAFYSDLATRILASKYFYGDADLGTDPTKGGREHSLKQVIRRVSETLASVGLKSGYFETAEEAALFERELRWLLVNQYGAFNSPVWFNLGLYTFYGTGKNSNEGNYYWDTASESVKKAPNQYEYPQCSACFIQSVDDHLESIMDLAKAEAMLFKFGSGSGTDLSSIRSSREKLSGGGRPSGPLSFLAVYDSVAGVVKSGGKTRRAAKMNTLRDTHPDIEEFITAKSNEEKKAWALIEQGYSPSFNGEAYGSVKFQNENLSVRASDAFMKAAESDQDWWTKRVSDGKPCEKKRAGTLLQLIAEGTHLCGDPGMQFDDTIHRWHTCKGSGRQNCTNPCSEYLFLDNSACNLASLNLVRFFNDNAFDAESFAAACRIFIIAQDILVDLSSYPTPAITYNSHWFRTLGLGFANLGSLLMRLALPYDSDEGRAIAASISSLMTGTAYRTSAEIAQKMGPFEGWNDARYWGQSNPPQTDNRKSMLEVIELHLKETERLCDQSANSLSKAALDQWKTCRELGQAHGFRNAQVTVLAPTGTIGFLMDCDTTGIEPAMGLVVYKQLAGGGMMTLPLGGISNALKVLGYTESQIRDSLNHVEEFGTLENHQDAKGTLHPSPISDKHLAIFDTSFTSGSGKRFLKPKAHVDMMAAVQPFLSGGISKTVNVPSTTTLEEIKEIYLYAWKQGIKGVAIYRDGSKRSAPLSTKKAETGPSAIDPNITQINTVPYRRKMNDTRDSVTHKFKIAGSKGYITVGKFEDGSPGEVFIQMSKAGSTINGLMDTIGTLLSLSLQYGVPLDTIVDKFKHVRFEPEGLTANPQIPFAKSVMDYLAKWIEKEFVEKPVQPSPSSTHHDESHSDDRPAPSQLEFSPIASDHLVCSDCGSSKVKITGTCACCLNCGSSLGCS